MDVLGKPIRKFNPGTLQSDDEIRAQFVVRQYELDIVLEVLHGNLDTLSCQHVLIVAPRGRGKTMLLARVAAELRTDTALSECLLPVQFMEESQEIFTLADFWLETLFHLARASEAHDPEFARELRATHADLAGRWREQMLEDHARAAVLDAANRLGKKLVLMVENLQALCESVDDDFGWKLRGALQSEPQIILLATATSRFERLDDAQEPFFELFRTVQLEPLNTEECRRLWQIVSGDTVSRREIRPLEILTGGSPRLLVIVAGFAQHRSLRRLMEELVTLIDEHTEYFRGHLEVLPKVERRVYVAVLDLWRLSSPSEIAARARIDARVVSTMLGRLVKRGAVRKAGHGRKQTYAAAEPLYSIYYKLRRERDEAAVVENLILFMVAFYDSSELSRMRHQLLSEAMNSTVVQAGIARALARKPPARDIPSRMKWDFVKEVSDKVEDHRQAMAEDRLEKDIKTAFQEGALERVIEVIERFVASGRLKTSQRSEQWLAYLSHMKAGAYFQMGDLQAVITMSNDIRARFRKARDILVLYRFAEVLLQGAMARFELGDFLTTITQCKEVEKRLSAFNAPPLQQSIAEALLFQAKAQRALGNYEPALSLVNDVVERFGDSKRQEVQGSVIGALLEKGHTIRAQQKEAEAAIAAYDEVIRRCGKSEVPEANAWIATALLNRGFARSDLGDFEGEIVSYQELIDRYGSSDTPEIRMQVAIALGCKGIRLAEMGRAEEALHTCEEFEGRIDALTENQITWGEWLVRGIQALALMVQQKQPAAMAAFRSAYAVFPPNDTAVLNEMLRLVLDLIAAGASEHDLVEILMSDGAKSGALEPLIVALRQRGGETVRAPTEVLEIAADVRKRIEEAMAEGFPVASSSAAPAR